MNRGLKLTGFQRLADYSPLVTNLDPMNRGLKRLGGLDLLEAGLELQT